MPWILFWRALVKYPAFLGPVQGSRRSTYMARSLGEQQRIAFLRLLLHEPGLAFLDEATGALDIATEALMYKTLQQRSLSYISVGENLCTVY